MNLFKDKRILIVVAVCLILIIAIIVMLTIVLSKNQQQFKNGGSKELVGTEKVYYPQIINSNEMIYLAGQEQSFKKLSLGSKQVIDSYPVDVPYISQVTYSLDKQKVILKTNDSTNAIDHYFVYNFSQKQLVDLSPQVIEAIWDDNNLIVRSSVEDKDKYYEANWDKTQPEQISFPFDKCDQIIAYNKALQDLICAHTNEDMSQNVFDIKTNKQIISNALMEYKTSPDYKKILFITKDQTLKWYNLENSQLTEIKASPVYEEINWSADGTAIIYYAQNNQQISRYTVKNKKIDNLFKIESIDDPMINYNNGIYYKLNDFLYQELNK